MGKWTAIASTPKFADGETPSGTADGSNVTFTLAHTPAPATSLQLFVNGDFQVPTVNYTISGATVTFTNAPASGDVITAFYRY